MKRQEDRRVLLQWFYEMRIADLRTQVERECHFLEKSLVKASSQFVHDCLVTACDANNQAKDSVVSELFRRQRRERIGLEPEPAPPKCLTVGCDELITTGTLDICPRCRAKGVR